MEERNINQQEIEPILLELFEFKPRKGDFKKIEIIKACIECLATLGLTKTTYEAIAQKIGTRRAHVAYHFQDKHELYMSAIKYCLATYQRTAMEHLSSAKTGEQMLEKYVEAGFAWAKENPMQVSVLLLLYYFCSLKPQYKELNQEVKKRGQERIYYILTEKIDPEINREFAKFLSFNIQSLTSQAILDSATTDLKTLDTYKKDVLRVVKSLLSTNK